MDFGFWGVKGLGRFELLVLSGEVGRSLNFRFWILDWGFWEERGRSLNFRFWIGDFGKRGGDRLK
ncbi:MAG: hypothetical protein VKJ64_06195 [Leptolyngbyaceae bacterium]|nr:hypothetical protein [Leptolyngbyaceae bacterium]